MQGELEKNSDTCKDGLQSFENDLKGDNDDKHEKVLKEDFDVHENNDRSNACELQVTNSCMLCMQTF